MQKALEDKLAAEWLLQEHSPVTNPAVFHIQQAVEKLLKGYLTSESIRFEKKHDLTYLLSLCPDRRFEKFSDFCEELSPFAVEIRYPGDFAPVSRETGLALFDQLRMVQELTLHLVDVQG